jgi:hypothetical protein
MSLPRKNLPKKASAPPPRKVKKNAAKKQKNPPPLKLAYEMTDEELNEHLRK